MKIETIVVGLLRVNCYVLYDEESKDAVIIDPGDEPNKIMELTNKLNIVPKEIWLTHGHFDHVSAASSLSKEFNVKIYMHDKDYFLYKKSSDYAAMFSIRLPAPTVDPVFFNMNIASAKVGRFCVDIMHTPGHSPGGLSFYSKETNVIFTGDLIFRSSVGRTDTEGGSYQVLEKSILENIYTKGESCLIYPGHGSTTTVGREKKQNPFVRKR